MANFVQLKWQNVEGKNEKVNKIEFWRKEK